MSKDNDDGSNISPAEKAKRSGMQQVEENANELWIEFMVDLVWDVCRERKQFTSDDVYDLYYAVPEDKRPETHEHRAMGPVMNRAAREGLCEKANLPAIPSRRASLHASPRTVWNSLIYEGE
jgi:hypothetical protein